MNEQDNNNQNEIDGKTKLMAQLQANGGNVFFVAALIVAGFFGWQYWSENRVATVDTVASDKYLQIQDANNKIKIEQQTALAAANTSSNQTTDDNGDGKSTDSDEATTKDADKTDSLAAIDKKQAQLDKHILDLASEHANGIYAWKALMLKARNEIDSDKFSQAVTTLESASNLKLDDIGLLAITNIRYAQALLADNQAEKALTTINNAQIPSSFEPSKQEVIGDIKLALNEVDAAKEAYSKAWDILSKRKESRGMLILKMESLGIKYTPIEVDSLS